MRYERRGATCAKGGLFGGVNMTVFVSINGVLVRLVPEVRSDRKDMDQTAEKGV